MTDLEELFRPLIDESARHRESVATIEARVRDRRVRRRRLRAQYRFGAGFVAVVLIATAVGVVHARGDRSPARPGRVATTTPPTPTTVAPAGWTTYDYGLARLSVPPGWTAAERCPPPEGHALVVEVPGVDQICPTRATGAPVVVVSSLPPPTAHEPYVTNAEVNGIPYEAVFPKCVSLSCPSLIAYVPSLKVAISFVNVTTVQILKTLTYSTYARVLQQPFGAVPASWKTVTFDGFSVHVPADWPTVGLSNRGFCYPAANTVYIGTPTNVDQCAFLRSIEPRESSLQLEPTDVSSPATEPTGWHHNGLRFTQRIDFASSPLSTELFLAVDGPRGRVLVTLGLGLDFTVARGILGSLEPVGS